MWFFTNKGFISVVEDKVNPDLAVVRARQRGVLEELYPLLAKEVVVIDGRDYMFRITMPKETFRAGMIKAMQEIDYTNFKNSIENRPYENACHSVWSTMSRLQPVAPYSLYSRSVKKK